MICWVGDFEVKPLEPGNPCFDGIAGAFVPVLGLAENRAAFLATAERELIEAGFGIVECTDPEPFPERRSRARIADYLADASAGLNERRRIFIGHLQAWGH